MRAYLSHPIRGIKGADATREDMEANNRRAMAFADTVRASLPGLDLYVPAEHDEFVLRAYEMDLLDETKILAVDKRILRDRDFLIVYCPDGHISSGMSEEIAAAQDLCMSIAFTQGSVRPISGVLEGIVT